MYRLSCSLKDSNMPASSGLEENAKTVTITETNMTPTKVNVVALIVVLFRQILEANALQILTKNDF